MNTLFQEYTEALVNEFGIDIGKCEEILSKILKKDEVSAQKEAERRKHTFILNLDIMKHVHEDTGMVLNPIEKKIIGKLHNKKIVDLNHDDIEICKKWEFKVDEAQLENPNYK